LRPLFLSHILNRLSRQALEPVASFFNITYQVDSPTLISGTITIDPLCPIGLVDLFVENPDGHTASMLNSFEVLETTVPTPHIDSIIPASAYQGDTFGFQLNGGNFQTGATFYVEPVAGFFNITYQVDSPTQISGTIEIDPLCPIGYVDLFVENPDGYVASLYNGFEVLEFSPDSPYLEWMDPSSAFQGDTINFQISGGNFQTGATLEFPGLDSFIGLTYQVDSGTLLSGTMTIDPTAIPGSYDVRITNPDLLYGSLFNGFTVYELVPELAIESINPYQLCRRQITDVVVLGQAFEPGSEFTVEYLGFPTDYVTVQSVTYVNSTQVFLLIEVTEYSPLELFDLRVENPDSSYAYGPQIEVIECGEGILLWQEGLLDVLIQYDGPAGVVIETTSSAMLQIAGEVSFNDIVVGMTGLVSADGREIISEYVEIFPSPVGEMGTGQQEIIQVRFSIPMDEELVLLGGGVFMGSLVARDNETGLTASLPVSVTIITTGTQVIEIDPLCLQVDLLGPGVPAGQVPGIFDISEEFPSSLVEYLGGCTDPFPLFQWTAYGSGCDGYMETWLPSYTLSVYPIYPSQSPESAVSNNPVWRAAGINEEFIQYSPAAEPLSGLYLWQVEAVPEPMPGLAITVDNLTPVLSEIWAFCVETDEFQEIPEFIIEGDIMWYPESLVLNGAGMVKGNLVLSHEIIPNLGTDPISISWQDAETGDTLVTWLGNVAVLQLSYESPAPDFGPVTIPFGVNLAPIGNVGPEMGPEDFVLQFWNGGSLICGTDLGLSPSGQLTGMADIGGSISTFDLTIIWPWEDPCWEVWLDWWLAKTELDEDCEDEWDALEEAEDLVQEFQDALNEANEALDEALDAYLDKLIESMQADLALESAQTACEDFFANHIFSNVINFSDPGGEGWSYFEAFGGQVGIWFLGDEGAELLNFFMDEYGSEYNALWDQLREAQDTKDEADENLEDAENAFDDASDARDAAQQALEDANDEYNVLLADLNNCLAYMNYLAEYVAWLEWFYEDCFRSLPGGTSSGVGTPGLEGGAQGPPIDEGTQPGGVTEDSGTGTQPGTDTGIGTGAGDCPCDDCDDEYADLLIAELFLELAEQDLDDLLNQFDNALAELDQAQDELDEAQEAYDAAEEAAEETQDKLDNFVDNHVFSDVVGGTPDHGSGHVKYKGVDFYFSDFDIFHTIFKILQEWIDEAAAANEAAQEALIEADANLLAADVKLLDAMANVARLQNDVTAAQNAVVQAEQEYLDALLAYLDCVDFARLCHEIFGCPPFVAPHETDQGGLPGAGEEPSDGDQPGDDESETEQPGVEEGETEQPGDTEGPTDGEDVPGIPPGQGTGDGTEEGDRPCPCGDCEDELEALVQAHVALANAEDANTLAAKAYVDAMTSLMNATETIQDAEQVYETAQEVLQNTYALLENAETPLEKEIYQNAVDIALDIVIMSGMNYRIAQIAFDEALHQVDVAADHSDTAWNQFEQALENVKAAEQAYFDCLEALENCRRRHDCEDEGSESRPEDPSIPIPSDPEWPGPWDGGDDQPGGTIPGGGTTPGDGGIPGDGTTPGEPFGGDVPDDTSSGELGECPCDDCAWELEMLKLAEEFMEMAEADWHNALDALLSAYEESAAAEADLESLEAQEEGAQEAVDELQEKLDEFMEKHVFVNGVGGDPSAGPNHVVYKGVHMYFSNANMLMNVFDLIKEGIDKLANSLAEAKADLEAIQESLESARERLEAAEAAEAEAEANEQEAWEAYENANDFYIDALVDYMLCLADRAACLDEYPEECAGESLEPGGSSGSGGSDGKSASGNQNHKQPDPGDDDEEEEEGPVQPYSLDELTSGLDALLLLTTQNLAEQELMTDRLMAGVIGTRKCLDEVFAELRDAIVKAGEKAMASEALVSAMPDSSWILTVYAVPDSDYEVKEHGSLFIYYPSGSEAEIDDWLIEYEDELEEFAKPAEFMPVDLADAIEGLSNSLEAYNHGIGLVAGYSSMVESLTEYSGMLNELVDTASKTLSENNSNIQEVMDDLNALRAEAEELGH
jgi:hypothetical protein